MTVDPFDGSATSTADRRWFLLSVFLTAGSIIALQIMVMRLFSIAAWAHFGSLVISVAMFGFGLASAIMCLANDLFQRHGIRLARIGFLLLGPAIVLGNVAAQQAQFNPIFLLADSSQSSRLLFNFASYALPFLIAALLLGIAFATGRQRFQLTYAADMIGSGVAGIACLLLMAWVPPDFLLIVPLVLGWGSALSWFAMQRDRRGQLLVTLTSALAVGLMVALPQIQVSPYKGVSYAAKFPDARRLHHAYGAHGLLEIYASSYFHFAPGLSDMASLSMEELPGNTYLGLYLDSDGPIGIMKELKQDHRAYYGFLPLSMPYLVRPNPEAVFVVQFGGGISTRVALESGAAQVKVAEGNPMILDAFAVPEIRQFTGDILADHRLKIVPMDGQLYMRSTSERYQVIDLSLADSTGLSNPGGFAVSEKYLYTKESMVAYMNALAPGGVLAVTVWNKENPPKSTLRLFATLAEAGEQVAGEHSRNAFYAVHVPLSTTTILFKKGGFTPEELARLDDYSERMAFGVIYRPGERFTGDGTAVMNRFTRSILEEENPDTPEGPLGDDEEIDISVTAIYRLLLDRMIHGEQPELIRSYPFDITPLTDDRPYFSGYIRLKDLSRFASRLEAISDEWGYLLLWFTLGQAALAGVLLLTLPLLFGWRAIFGPQPGKFGILGYFFALGLGYILVEIALIGKFIAVLGNAVISTSILITGMLLSTGLGSLVSSRYTEQVRTVMPRIFLAIVGMLVFYGVALDPLLPVSGSLGYRIGICVLLLAPLAFLMGFPFATGMSWLARLGKEHFFLWAWGINGMFSVMGAVLVPIVAVSLGLSANLFLAAALYLLAWPCLLALLRPLVRE
ncbi:MAG: hypothetical protein HQL86_02365 [Magnetococcales bacterium]|nr:hypothetical protein [Magnetococcales bacterium]